MSSTTLFIVRREIAETRAQLESLTDELQHTGDWWHDPEVTRITREIAYLERYLDSMLTEEINILNAELDADAVVRKEIEGRRGYARSVVRRLIAA